MTRQLKTTLILTLVLLAGVGMSAHAHRQPVAKMYMFGIAASFTDTIVHVTDIQALDSVWIETKNNFLQERDSYSYQLRSYLEDKEGMSHRTCIVFYSKKREKLEKKYRKMMGLYGKDKNGQEHFDVRHVDGFQFHTIDISELVAQEEQQPAEPAKAPKAKNKKKEKKGK